MSKDYNLKISTDSTRLGWLINTTLPPLNHRERYPWVSTVQETGGPKLQYGWVWKISPTQGFDTQTVQAVASCYTDWAILPACK